MAKRQRSSLAELVVAAAFDESFEARDISALAARFGLENRTLQRWCAARGLKAKQCLDLVRGMQVINAPGRWKPRDFVARYYKDYRSIDGFLAAARLPTRRPAMIDFLRRQRFVGPSPLRAAIIRTVRRRQRRHGE